MGTAKERRERLQQLPEIIRANGGKIAFGELYARLDIKWGMMRKTLWDYLSTLKTAGAVKYQGESDDVLIVLNPEWKP
jgi:hypothetical protein